MNKLTVGFITTLSERLQLIVQLRLRYTCFISCGLICPLLLLTSILIIFLQDEVSAQISGAFDNPNNAVRIHHSLASIASDYRFEITANNTSLSAGVKFVVLPSFLCVFCFSEKRSTCSGCEPRTRRSSSFKPVMNRSWEPGLTPSTPWLPGRMIEHW